MNLSLRKTKEPTFDAERLAEKTQLMHTLMKASSFFFVVFGLRDLMLHQGVVGSAGLIRAIGSLALLGLLALSYRLQTYRLPKLMVLFEFFGSVILSSLIMVRPEGPESAYGGFMAAIVANAAIWSNRKQLLHVSVVLILPPLVSLYLIDASYRAWVNYLAFFGIAIFTCILLFKQRSNMEIAAYRLRLQLEEKVISDSLTGVLNREGWNRHAPLTLKYCDERKQPAAMLFLDVDHFKSINDIRGHAAGDMVLEKIAMLLPGSVRSRDVIARLGGEEFVVLMPGATMGVANKVAERVRSDIHRHFTEFEVTVSIGVAERLENELLESLQKRADVAMYHAKRNGRNRVELAA